ncbi:hypothetical protein AAC387_Pa02g3052 [Persea americana]
MSMATFHLLWVLLMLLPISAYTQTAPTINMGSTLSPSDNSSWVSPSGEFAFGFRPLEGNSKLFLLGIWFDKIPQKTLVWSVNRDNPVQEGSKVSLMDGELILRDNQGQEIWRAQTNGTVTSAAMRNDGNFVLMGTGSASRWESFTDPTDTILPSQRLGLSGMLSSRESETNYSSGKFRLNLQSDGNLVLEEVALPSKNPYGAYWKSGTAGDGTQVVFNLTGYIYITLQNGSRSNLTQGNIVSTGDFYQRATLDYDGVFRQYVYPKTKNLSDSGQWGESWTAVLSVPQDICMAASVDVGGGVCGFNGYCRLDGNQPTCLCPNGYTYLDANNRYKGCRENFVPQSCASDDSVKEPLFGLDEMINTDWPLSDYEHYKPVNENQCREACLGDCLCAVAIFRDGDCWKKKLPLSNGRMNAGVGGKALIKVRRGNSTSPPGPPGSSRGKEDKGTLVLIISVILGSSGFLNFLLLAILLAIYFSYHKKVIKLTMNSAMIGTNVRSFTYAELEEITNGFKEELGRGSCGTVYKGIIPSDSINFVAVKKLDRVAKEAEKELKNEVSAIGRIHHKNLVQLLGYCHEGPNLLLIYDFMRNGSLANFLFGNPRPHWDQRTQIAFGIARGLMYLHEECVNQIIHCDIKPENILLDDCFTAKISDFGLAKLLKTNQTRTTTDIRGTKGYVAPEWFRNMAITAKVDVYSFGVMLLEIICCRKSFELDFLNEANAVLLIDWVCDCYKDGKIDELVEDDTEALNDARRLERMVMVAMWCIQEDPSLRPSMKKVTQMLEGAVEVAVPPDPCSFISSLG